MLRGEEQKFVIRNLSEFQVHPERGFLPSQDPLDHLPSGFDSWEEIAKDLPKILVTHKIRPILEQLPVLDVTQLNNNQEYERAMLVLSYLGHAYVWGETKPANRIPAGIAIPWYEVSKRLNRPPVLSYASYALHNWRRIDPNDKIALGNIVLLQNFLGGIDEEWFILVHVDIEAKAGSALAALVLSQQAVLEDQPENLEQHLTTIASSLRTMYETLSRMPEHCDPYIYYHRVRPYIHGWKNNPALPDGVIYEGVPAYGGKPQKFRGETGAQSSIIPSLDAALGILHKDDPLRPYLLEMRDYMPPRHRAFIEAIEEGPSIRRYVLDHHPSYPSLRELYNECVTWIECFRSKHLEYAARYIQHQSQRDFFNPTTVGTGGTPFMAYLKKHRDETSEHVI